MTTTPPNEYRREASFAEHNIDFPGEPLDGADVDSEFDELGRIVNQVIRRLGVIQRDDGKLRNQTVHYGSLSQQVIDFIVNYGGSGVQFPAEDDDGNVIIPPGGGGGTGEAGVVFFRQLLDVTPKTFAGAAGKPVVVNATATALEFGQFPTMVIRWNDIPNVQDLAPAVAGYILVANDAGDAAVWREFPIDLDGEYARLDIPNDWGFQAQNKMTIGTYRETLVSLNNIAGVVTINPALGNHFRGNIVGDCGFVLSGLPPAGSVYSFSLCLTSPGGTYAHTWFPSGTVNWGPAGAPVVSAGSTNWFSFVVYPDGLIGAFNPR